MARAKSKVDTRVEVHKQFWRESEQRWVDHVCIWRSESAILGGTDLPKKWRHRRITTTITTGEWMDGQS